MVAVTGVLAQSSVGDAKTAARTGSDVANWADSPEKLVAVWVVGGLVLIAVVVLLVRTKMDKG